MPDLTVEEIEALYARSEKPQQKPRVEIKDWQPDDLLTRIEVTVALDALGFSMNRWPITYNRLTKMSLRRIGPPYSRVGNKTFYRYADFIEWAERYADRRPT